MDAMSRGLGFHTYPKQEPSTISVAIKTKEQVGFYMKDSKLTDMGVYMMTRKIPALEDMSIREFFRLFYYSFKEPNFHTKVEGVDYFILPYGRNKVTYLKQYVRNDLRVVRLEMLYPDVGEPYYLRVILKNRAINRGGWKDILSFPPYGEPNSKLYGSYQAVARASGYLGGKTLVFRIIYPGNLCCRPGVWCFCIFLTSALPHGC
jgi:hypothetical protein